jgi:pimeloyl-ACP methyl ester carboxylesterase
VSADEVFVQTGQTRLFCRRAGDGDRLLVLLHGWPQTSYCWRHLVEPLARERTVVAPDLAGYGADLADDERDHTAGRRLAMPLLLLWGADGGLGGQDVPGVWRDYAADVRGQAVRECKHFLPEEQPAAVLAALEPFFAGGTDTRKAGGT